MDIFEIAEKNFKIESKIQNIVDLIANERYYYGYGNRMSTFEEYFELKYLRSWQNSNGCIRMDEFRNLIGVKYYFNIANQKTYIRIENETDIIIFLQYAINIVNHYKSSELGNDEFLTAFFNTYDYILEKYSHNVIYDSNKKYYIVIPNNEKVNLVVKDVNENYGLLFLEYISPLIKGDISEKRKIITLLSNLYEKKHKQSGSREAYLGLLLNNFGIRHDNENPDSRDYKEELSILSEKEWEKVYDIMFELMIDIRIDKNFEKIKQEIEEIKAKVGIE